MFLDDRQVIFVVLRFFWLRAGPVIWNPREILLRAGYKPVTFLSSFLLLARNGLAKLGNIVALILLIWLNWETFVSKAKFASGIFDSIPFPCVREARLSSTTNVSRAAKLRNICVRNEPILALSN